MLVDWLTTALSRARSPRVATLCFAASTLAIALYVAYSSGSLETWAAAVGM